MNGRKALLELIIVRSTSPQNMDKSTLEAKIGHNSIKLVSLMEMTWWLSDRSVDCYVQDDRKLICHRVTGGRFNWNIFKSMELISVCNCMWGHQVQGFKGNMFKSFNSRIEAQQYMDDPKPSTSGRSLLQKPALSETVQKTLKKRPKSPTPLSIKRKHSYINTSISAQPPSPQVPETFIPATQVCITYLGACQSEGF